MQRESTKRIDKRMIRTEEQYVWHMSFRKHAFAKFMCSVDRTVEEPRFKTAAKMVKLWLYTCADHATVD